MIIWKDFTFEAAHLLPNVPEGHKCGRLHGHSYRVRICVSGEPGAETGWIMDYADIKAEMAPLIDQLDHRYLNDIEGLENPTTEAVAVWIHERTPPTWRVEVSETCTSGCVVG